MLQNFKKTFKHTAIFAFGRVGSKLVGFVLLPLYTREILVADYGVLGILELLELLGSHVFSLAIQTALFRYYSLAHDESEKKRLYFTSYTFLFVLNALLFVVVWATSQPGAQLLFGDSAYGRSILFMSAAMIFGILNKIPFAVLRIEEKSVAFAALVIGQFSLSLVLNILFVASLKMGIEGVLLSNAISQGMLWLWLIPYSLRRMQFSFDRRFLFKMVKFSAPLVLAALAAAVTNMGDRVILGKLADFSQTGLYTLGQKFSNIIKVFIIDSFNLGLPIVGWQVVKHNQNPQRFFAKAFTYLMVVLVWSALVLSVFSKGIIHLVAENKAYWEAWRVVPVLAAGAVGYGIQNMFMFIFQIPKKTIWVSYVMGFSAILSVAGNFLLIPYFGMMGAAVTVVGAQYAGGILAYYQAQKYYPVPYELGKIARLFGIAVAIYGVSLLLDTLSTAERILFKGVLVLGFPLYLYFLNFYEPVEIERLKGAARKWMRKAAQYFR